MITSQEILTLRVRSSCRLLHLECASVALALYAHTGKMARPASDCESLRASDQSASEVLHG